MSSNQDLYIIKETFEKNKVCCHDNVTSCNTSQNRWSTNLCACSKPMQSLVKPCPCLVTTINTVLAPLVTIASCLCLLMFTDSIYIGVSCHHYATLLILAYVQLSICHSYLCSVF